MNNIEEIKKIKEWLKESNIELPLETKINENKSLSCIPIEEVDELLEKCACELGVEYKR